MNPGSKTSNQNLFKTFLCVAAYLPMMIGGAETFVLCFGQCGHLAIEFPHEGGHDHAGNHLDGSATENNGSISNEGCKSCFDIPLTPGHDDPHTVKDNIARAAALQVVGSMQPASCAPDPNHDKPMSLSNGPPPPARHSLEGLDTTVLRT